MGVIGFEDRATRTSLTIPNINMKVSSEDVPTVILPQKDSAAFRNLCIDHDDGENKARWTEKTLEQMSTRDHCLGRRIPGLHPERSGAEPHAGLGPAPPGAAPGGAHGRLREADPDPDSGLREEAAAARRHHRAGRPLRHHPRAATGARHPDRGGSEPARELLDVPARVLRLSIETILEAPTPNLWEGSLSRIVDFGSQWVAKGAQLPRCREQLRASDLRVGGAA